MVYNTNQNKWQELFLFLTIDFNYFVALNVFVVTLSEYNERDQNFSNVFARWRCYRSCQRHLFRTDNGVRQQIASIDSHYLYKDTR